MLRSSASHLPITAEECRQRGWDEVDIILVSGDCYIDHPSFGIAILGRLLEHHGFRVAILPQPRYNDQLDFTRFGRPRLFFGITAGNLDSIVANYTGNGKVRDFDAYSENGSPWWGKEKSKASRKRPDRASLIYANLARRAYTDVPVVLGGIEASLRRFVHYDYKQQKLRSSILSDAKADLLVYGMAEKTILEVAERLREGLALQQLPGSCNRLTDTQFSDFRKVHTDKEIITLPSWEDIQKDKSLFMEAEALLEKRSRSNSQALLAQRQQSHWILQQPAQAALSEEELDAIYDLPFCRTPHPSYDKIPAYDMIRHSITTVRGCSGNCSFCAISRHQGTEVSSRSNTSILNEAKQVCSMKDFSGTITDLGGPTANLFGTECKIGGCKKHDCLYPRVCEHLRVNEDKMLLLLDDIVSLEKVKHVFISSGLRMELLLKTPSLLKRILKHHTPGSLKIAPEHTEKKLLELMHKEPHSVLHDFVKTCRRLASKEKKQLHLTPYVITAHPGSTERSAESLVRKMKELGLQVRQFQDFTPTPGTLSTAMYVSGLDTKGNEISVPDTSQKSRQRNILEKAFHRRQVREKRKKSRKKK